MDNTKVAKYAVYSSIPVAILFLYWKQEFFIRLRQRWLVNYGHKNRNEHNSDDHGEHEHGHDHGHGHGDLDVKLKLFHGLNQLTQSTTRDLKGHELGIRILEIGVGSGANFQFFPDHCQLVTVDPNPYFEQLVTDNLAKFPGVKLERRLICGADDMSEIESASVDVVVATLVFCQVKDVPVVFNEIKRVLVPGGKFYYLDHVASEAGTFRRFCEEVATKSGISRLLFNGVLTRDIGKDIPEAGFSDINQNYDKFRNTRVVYGIATK